MLKLRSSREVLFVLQKEGFIFVSQRGSHAKYRKLKGGKVITAIVPIGRKEIPLGTLRSVIRQSQLPKEKFFGSVARREPF